MVLKKFFVITVLFALPLVAYLFFASGVNKFARLPVLTPAIEGLADFESPETGEVSFKEHITVLGFIGEDPLDYTVGAYNLSEKIYDTYHEFKNFQFVYVASEDSQEEVAELQKKLSKVVDMGKWKFVFGSPEEITALFESLGTDLELRENLGSPNVFIIDKKGRLRGRNEDEDEGLLYGYNSRSVAEINNKMDDDVKVILAEYRLALKKYNSDIKPEQE